MVPDTVAEALALGLLDPELLWLIEPLADAEEEEVYVWLEVNVGDDDAVPVAVAVADELYVTEPVGDDVTDALVEVVDEAVALTVREGEGEPDAVADCETDTVDDTVDDVVPLPLTEALTEAVTVVDEDTEALEELDRVTELGVDVDADDDTVTVGEAEGEADGEAVALGVEDGDAIAYKLKSSAPKNRVPSTPMAAEDSIEFPMETSQCRAPEKTDNATNEPSKPPTKRIPSLPKAGMVANPAESANCHKTSPADPNAYTFASLEPTTVTSPNTAGEPWTAPPVV